jgi:hypothetical protein
VTPAAAAVSDGGKGNVAQWVAAQASMAGSRPGGLVAPEKGQGGELAGGRQWRDGGGRWRAGKGDDSVFIRALALVTKW